MPERTILGRHPRSPSASIVVAGLRRPTTLDRLHACLGAARVGPSRSRSPASTATPSPAGITGGLGSMSRRDLVGDQRPGSSRGSRSSCALAGGLRRRVGARPARRPAERTRGRSCRRRSSGDRASRSRRGSAGRDRWLGSGVAVALVGPDVAWPRGGAGSAVRARARVSDGRGRDAERSTGERAARRVPGSRRRRCRRRGSRGRGRASRSRRRPVGRRGGTRPGACSRRPCRSSPASRRRP